MAHKLIVIFKDGLRQEMQVPPEKDITLDMIRDMMNLPKCFVAHQSFPVTGGPLHIFCDEDGIMKGQEFNHEATVYARENVPGRALSYVGPVVFFWGVWK